jgi:N-acetylneuraminate synthase
MKNIVIEHVTIGNSHKPFIIAEMSGNHNQSLERALEIVDAAAQAGCHAIKLQTYTPDTMTIENSTGLFEIDDPNSLWVGRNLYDLYKEAYTPWEWHEPSMKLQLIFLKRYRYQLIKLHRLKILIGPYSKRLQLPESQL